jgi:hypothetical protein
MNFRGPQALGVTSKFKRAVSRPLSGKGLSAGRHWVQERRNPTNEAVRLFENNQLCFLEIAESRQAAEKKVVKLRKPSTP